ncbi:podocalyxin-like protein 2 [Ambystoma mexicanum]|uniref:podocalyxin-like protein 2 n=1 Tax=Ambystoma mexicanum TaxID=8296 RepID=UPI0037E89889
MMHAAAGRGCGIRLAWRSISISRRRDPGAAAPGADSAGAQRGDGSCAPPSVGPLPPPAAMTLARLLLVVSASAWFGCVASEHPTTDGLTSTSLMELTMISHLESLDSGENGPMEVREPGLLTTLLQAPQGSGSSSQENEESTILQSPQYFLEDGADANESSRDLGPPTDDTFPVSSHKAGPRGNETEHRDPWETATPELSMDVVDQVTHTSYTHGLAEEDAVLQVDRRHRGKASEVPVQDSNSPGSKWKDDPLYSIASSAVPNTTLVTDPVGGKESLEEEASLRHAPDSTPEMSLHPSLVPMSYIPQDSSNTFVDTHAGPVENPTGNFVERKQAEGISDKEINHLEVPVDPHGSSNGSSSTLPVEKKEFATIATQVRKIPLAATITPSITSEMPEAPDTVKATLPAEVLWNSPQVICKDWSNLAGKNYIILNMSDDINCELFRLQKGQQLLSIVEDALSRKNDRLQESWVISLSKPNENDRHLLMTLVGEQGVVPIKEVLTALGDIRRSLSEIGIQNYSTTTSCHSRPSQTRSDYGKLFVVLVIIGSICVMIIVSGLIYICWQRRLPKLKNMSRGEELHFVENGCHDNPTLDVTMDSQSEMQEKKPSLNGGTLDGADSWNVLIDKKNKEEGDVAEEDTHL